MPLMAPRPEGAAMPRSSAEGYVQGVQNALPYFQQARAFELNNPDIERRIALAPLLGSHTLPQNWQQYSQQSQIAQPVRQFAGYLDRQGTPYEKALTNLSTGNLNPYQTQLQNYGSWIDQETRKRNASGILSKGLGSMLPGLAMMAFPGAGLAKIATSAAIGGLGGGIRGALVGGLGSAIAPSISIPGGITSVAKAPIQAAANVTKQLASPSVFARQLASSGIGSLQQRRA